MAAENWPCPDPSPHTHDKEQSALGYIAWHDWAAGMEKTHKQKPCPNCGLFKVWVKREASRGR